MKLEIKTKENGDCEYFKINGRKFGKGIVGYEVYHDAGQKPLIILQVHADEFILDSENCKLYLDNLKAKENIFKRIINKLKK